MNTEVKKSNVTAVIGGMELTCNFCSSNRNSYSELEKRGDIKYVGQGFIDKVDGVKQNFYKDLNNALHFWVYS